jgi:hypothetical protein
LIVSINVRRRYYAQQLHSVHWKDVAIVHRELFSIAAVHVVFLQLDQLQPHELFRIADTGILLGADEMSIKLLQHVIDNTRNATALQSAGAPKKRTREEECADQAIISVPVSSSLSVVDSAIQQVDRELSIAAVQTPSLMTFYNAYLVPQVPVLILGCMDDWPAMQKHGPREWSNIQYILQSTALSPSESLTLTTLRV